MSEVTIQFSDGQLKHIRFILLYLATYGLLRKEGEIPALGIEDRIETEDLMVFHRRFESTPPGQPLHITVHDVLYLYSCYYLSTSLLVSRYDAQVYENLFRQVPQYQIQSSLSEIRTIAVQNNLVLMKDLEKGFCYLKSLHAVKQYLQSFHIG